MKREVRLQDALLALTSLVCSIVSLIYFFVHKDSGYLLATITFGSTSAPSDIAIYFDSVFSQSLANYRKTMTDNIGATNAFLAKLIKSELYEPYEGGTDIREPLMYALAPMESYDGFDELSSATTDGVTEAVFEARQLATPVTYSMKEVIQNKLKITSLVKTKMMQGEMGIQEGFAIHLMNGSGNGAGRTAKVNAANGSTSIIPLAQLIDYTPTTSTLIGNINQSTSTWWRNKTKTSSATTSVGFLAEVLNIYNSCALGSGGPPDLMLCDQITYELLVFAYFAKYQQINSDSNFNFTNFKFMQTMCVMDDKVGDVSGDLTSASAKGSIYFINSKFARCRYIPERNFEMLTDENGKSFAKPLAGDSRLGHIAWMGQFTVNNRRKQGVMGSIARTLT